VKARNDVCDIHLRSAEYNRLSMKNRGSRGSAVFKGSIIREILYKPYLFAVDADVCLRHLLRLANFVLKLAIVLGEWESLPPPALERFCETLLLQRIQVDAGPGDLGDHLKL